MMKPSIQAKLEGLIERYEEISHLLSDPSIISNQSQFRDLSKEYSHLEPIVACFNRYFDNEKIMLENKELLNDADPEIRTLAEEEIKQASFNEQELEKQL